MERLQTEMQMMNKFGRYSIMFFRIIVQREIHTNWDYSNDIQGYYSSQSSRKLLKRIWREKKSIQ